MDVKIEDENKAILLAVSLPSSYKHFKKILLHSSNETLSFEEVKASLLSKEKFDLKLHSNDKGEALDVIGKPFGKEGITRRNSCSKSILHKSNKFYKYYRKQGHLVDEYYSLKNKKEIEEKNKQPQKSTETSIIDSESNGDVSCVTTSNNRCIVECVLDLGCTYHMCPHRVGFQHMSC